MDKEVQPMRKLEGESAGDTDLYWYYRQFVRDGVRALTPLVPQECVHAATGEVLTRNEFSEVIESLRQQPARLGRFIQLLRSGFYSGLHPDKLAELREKLICVMENRMP